jgi:hypothetical protein
MSVPRTSGMKQRTTCRAATPTSTREPQVTTEPRASDCAMTVSGCSVDGR